MPRLDERSYRHVLRVIHAVREVSDPDDFGPTVLREIAGLVPSDVSSFNEVDPVGGRLAFTLEPSSYPVPPGSPELLGRYAHEHPLIRHQARTGEGSAMRISDFWTQEQWHESRIFRELYGPMGVEYQMAIGLPAPVPIVVGVALNRGRIDFDEHDRDVLNLLRPHLAQSWRQAREHRRLRALLSAASGALESTRSGVILLSNPPQELTRGALAQLYRYLGRPGPGDPLPPRVSRWVDGQRHLMGGAALPQPLSAVFDAHRLVLRFLAGADGAEDAILLHEDLAQAGMIGLGAAGLTAREAEVLRAVATGATNVAVGAELHISAATVKKHLDNVYGKLGVSNRTQAAAVMLEMVGHHQ